MSITAIKERPVETNNNTNESNRMPTNTANGETRTPEMKNKPKRGFVRLGFGHKESKELVKQMNILLAGYHVHYQKLRNFHWNIEGDDFYELHNQFEDLYNQSKVNIDKIAERIRTIGFQPTSTMKGYLKDSLIDEVDGKMGSKEMAREISHDIEILLSSIVAAHSPAAENGDLASIHLLMGMAYDLEKSHWMLRTWTK